MNKKDIKVGMMVVLVDERKTGITIGNSPGCMATIAEGYDGVTEATHPYATGRFFTAEVLETDVEYTKGKVWDYYRNSNRAKGTKVKILSESNEYIKHGFHSSDAERHSKDDDVFVVGNRLILCPADVHERLRDEADRREVRAEEADKQRRKQQSEIIEKLEALGIGASTMWPQYGRRGQRVCIDTYDQDRFIALLDKLAAMEAN